MASGIETAARTSSPVIVTMSIDLGSDLEVRVAVVAYRQVVSLDRPRASEADHVPDRAGFVVRPGGPGAAERLLTDDRAGRLVVDVEVAGRVAQRVGRLPDGCFIRGEDRSGEPIRGRLVHQPPRLPPSAFAQSVLR